MTDSNLESNLKIDSSGWLGCRQIASPNSDKRPEGIGPELLVIHNISLPPEEFGGGYIEKLFTNSLNPTEHPYFEEISDLRVSSHLLIDRAGRITQFVSFEDRAWHAGQSSWGGRSNCNDFSIGIELEGSDNQEFTEDQYRVLAETTRLIVNRYPSISAENITGHSDIAPGRKTDPGPLFNWNYFRELVS